MYMPKKRRGEVYHSAAPEHDSLSSEQRKALNRICNEAYRVVLDSEVIHDGEIIRKRSDLFLKVPSKTLYPDYRLAIKHPIALDVISDRIASNHYKSVSDFTDDMYLMFSNAQKYNVEGSEVYQDAVVMKSMLDEKIKELCGDTNASLHG